QIIERVYDVSMPPRLCCFPGVHQDNLRARLGGGAHPPPARVIDEVAGLVKHQPGAVEKDSSSHFLFSTKRGGTGRKPCSPSGITTGVHWQAGSAHCS
ncbi:MAG: hypothetical protein RMM10_13190, partial [Anaerolineae bacterium]|uniref:hypothetical protein n=1 Tax=Thermoflexus sp. TaxID=1969742 RepID=UPI0025D28C3B